MLIGHSEPAAAFRDAVTSGQLHHAWLLAGPTGIGKATFARAAAQWLLARAASPAGVGDDGFDLDPDHPTARLIAAGSHLDLRTVEVLDNPKTGTRRPGIALDQLVRRPTTIGEPLSSVFQSTPALSDWRVVIIDSLDEMNRPTANALLKHLEEPPAGTLFLGISHAPGRLLPTLRSRCRVLRLLPLADADVATVLRDAMPDLPEEERAALVRIAAGSPGRALRFAEAGVAGLTADLDTLAHAGAAQATARALALAKALGGKAAAARYAALLELVPAYIAAAARSREGPRLARTLALWEKASALGGSALALSLDPQSVTFDLANLVAGLAET